MGSTYTKRGTHTTCGVDGCGGKFRAVLDGQPLCQTHYCRMRKHGSLDDPREAKFWANVDKTASAPCWIWTGYRHPESGYGRFHGQQAHRLTYEKLIGPIPEGLVLDHLCRVRACVNPAHLDPVPQRENIRRGEQGQCWGYVPPGPRPKPMRAAACSVEGCDRAPYKRGLCRDPHYKMWLRDPDRESAARTARTMTPEQRFWAKVVKGPGPQDCWIWTAAVHAQLGYGKFALGHGKTKDAHRYSYELIHGPVPKGLEVHHVCQNRACVNPRHLEAVPRSVNIRARVARQPLQSPGVAR